MTARVRIDLPQGIVEAEGTWEFLLEMLPFAGDGRVLGCRAAEAAKR